MSLDQNLFTLLFVPNKDHPNVVDLVDPSGTVHYHKCRVAGAEYKIEVYDPLSQSLLITATAPSPSSKVKTLELSNPTIVVELKYTGTLSFRWSFRWEDNDFEWKREQCFLIRKPDPPVLVAVTKEPSGRSRASPQVQILDYNINRFDIDDRKGLEIVMLTALMTFQDSNEAQRLESPSSPMGTSISRRTSAIPVAPSPAVVDDVPPPPPPKPAPKTGIDRIAEIQALDGDYNEIVVSDEGNVEDYAHYCNNLLQDDAMLFVTVKSSAAEHVPKVLQVVEETKRIRYKAGLDEDTELHQYVLYDIGHKKGPRRINLDDDAEQRNKYAPPSSLSIHLSKIEMPELQPKSQPSTEKAKKKKDDKKARPTLSPPSPSAAKPTPSPILPSASSSKPDPKPSSKPQKNKLTRPPPATSSNSNRKSYLPPPESSPQPPTGIFNAEPSKPSVTPTFPVPSMPKYETPGLSLYNSFMPYTPGPSPNTNNSHRPSSSMSGYQPTPPPPPPQAPPSGPPKLLSAASVQTVVSGIFDRLNHHHRK